MKAFKPRSRMISIRLSEEEYRALKRVCAASGARSVSDITRNAVRVLVMDKGKREQALAIDLARCNAQLMNLDQELKRLASEIAAIKPSVTTD